MLDNEKVGRNIQTIRKVFGETQEELGEAIGVAKNTISSYEHGKREPDNNTLLAIADHYIIPIDIFLNCDLSEISDYRINFSKEMMSVLNNSIFILMPIVSSEDALTNKHFKRAYRKHQSVFKSIIDNGGAIYDSIHDELNLCLSEYQLAFEDVGSKMPAAANIINIHYCYLSWMKHAETIMKTKPAFVRKFAKDDIELYEGLEEDNTDTVSEIEAFLDDFYNGSEYKKIWKYLQLLKTSQEWQDVADYYLIVQHLYGIANNGLELALNQQIGYQMLITFRRIGNGYAKRLLALIDDAF